MRDGSFSIERTFDPGAMQIRTKWLLGTAHHTLANHDPFFGGIKGFRLVVTKFFLHRSFDAMSVQEPYFAIVPACYSESRGRFFQRSRLHQDHGLRSPASLRSEERRVGKEC